MNESRHLDSGNLERPQAKGVLPPDDRVPKPMIPRDYHLKPICAVATTSKTSPSHDSKFETTVDQTTWYKGTTSILRNKNVSAMPRQIKLNDNNAHLKSHDCYQTGNTTTPHHQNEDTTIPRPPVPSLQHKNVAITPRQIKSHDETSPQTHHDPYLTCNTTPPPHHNSVTPDFRLNGVNDKRKPC